MSESNFKEHLYALVVAGGGGTRLWPKSRDKTPKQFLKLFKGRTLTQITLERLHNFLTWEKIFVITTSQEYKRELKSEVGNLHDENIIVEPMRRESAPAHGFGALVISQKDPDAVILNSAIDHIIEPIGKYEDSQMVAAEVAYKGNYLVAVGIEPDYPQTGYGYLKRGDKFEVIQDRVVYKLDRFVEKPELSIAKRFISSGKYYWNANQYVWRADSILKAIRTYAPRIGVGLEKISQSIGTKKEQEIVEDVYRSMPKISIDYAISEKADNFLLVPARYNWSDIGNWREVWENLPKDVNGNVIIDGEEPGGRVLNIDTSNALVHTDGRLIAIIDVDDIVIVDTKEALLVCTKSRAQNVKKIVEKLKKEKQLELL